MKLLQSLRSLLHRTYATDGISSTSTVRKSRQVCPAVEIVEDRLLMATNLIAMSTLPIASNPAVKVITVKLPAVSVPSTSQSTATSQQNGVAPNYMIALANELQSDAWLNMPNLADDDYVRGFGTQAANTLEPGRIIHIEWAKVSVTPVNAVALVK